MVLLDLPGGSTRKLQQDEFNWIKHRSQTNALTSHDLTDPLIIIFGSKRILSGIYGDIAGTEAVRAYELL